MKKSKKKKFNLLKSWFNSFTEPFEYFYLGVLSSMGLTFAILLIFAVLRTLIEPYVNFDILIYSRILFFITYLFFIGHAYYFFDMNRLKSLRNGFMLIIILYILIQISYWIIK